jgi:hypothetical protein
LYDRPGEAIQERSRNAILLLKPFADHADRQFIRNQFTFMDVSLSLPAQKSAVLNVLPEQVAGGYVRQSSMPGNDLCLRALANSGGTKENNIRCHFFYFTNLASS